MERALLIAILIGGGVGTLPAGFAWLTDFEGSAVTDFEGNRLYGAI